MDPNPCKHYATNDFDPKDLLETYFSPNTPKSVFRESTELLIHHIRKVFESGLVKGKHLLDLSLGPILFQVLAICEYVEDITKLEIHDACKKATKNWIKKKNDSYDWAHISAVLMERAGHSDHWHDREEMLRSKLKVVCSNGFCTYDPKEQLELSKADIFFSIWGLDILSKNKEDFCNNLKKISSYLNMDGYLLIYGDINASYLYIGKEKYHLLTYNDDFLKQALTEGGFNILHYENIERKCVTDVVDHEKIAFVVAQKIKE